MDNPTSKPIRRRLYQPKDEHRLKVARMAGVGIPPEQISVACGISVKTLRKHYKTELEESPIQANLRVLETLYQMATSGRNTAAAIFWTKVRGGLGRDLPPRPDASEPAKPPTPPDPDPKSPAAAKRSPKSRDASESPSGNVVFISPKGERVA